MNTIRATAYNGYGSWSKRRYHPYGDGGDVVRADVDRAAWLAETYPQYEAELFEDDTYRLRLKSAKPGPIRGDVVYNLYVRFAGMGGA